MTDRISNDDLWKRLNYEILLHARSEQWEVRMGAFKIADFLFAKSGERYLMLLNDTLPFLSEGLEDEKSDVELVVKGIIRRVEQLTGGSIQEYLK
jgi:U3 small nucleolar RNA-associated protein 10